MKDNQGKDFKESIAIAFYISRGCLNIDKDEYGKAAWNFTQALKLIDKFNVDEALFSMEYISSLYVGRGLAYLNIERYEEALEDYKTAINIMWGLYISGNMNNIVKLSRCNEQIAYAECKLGKLNEADKNYELAIITLRGLYEANKEEFEDELAGLYFNRGNVMLKMERYKEAIISYTSSIEVLSSIYDRTIENTNILINALKNRGLIYSILEEHREASWDLKFVCEFQNGLIKKGKIVDAHDLSKTYFELGNECWILQKYDEALKCYLKSISILNE